MTDRVYSLTCLAPGDYLLPSNDARTLWRIARYVDLDAPTGRQSWGLWRRPMPTMDMPFADITDWDGWERWAGPYDTRAETIDRAINH